MEHKDELLNIFSKSKYKIKELSNNRYQIKDKLEIYKIELGDKITLNGLCTTCKDINKIFFINPLVNKCIFIGFAIITVIFFSIYPKFTNFVTDNLTHNNIVHLIMNSVGLFLVYRNVRKLNYMYVIIIGLASLFLCSMFILFSGIHVIGSSGIVFAFTPFMCIRSKKNYILKLIAAVILLIIPSLIFPIFSWQIHITGYIAGAIVFIYIIKRDRKSQILILNNQKVVEK